MNFLLDENVPEDYMKFLKINGYKKVTHVNKKLKGSTDKDVFEYAVKNKMCIISHDSDFKDFRKNKHYGIIRLRASTPNKALIELLSKVSVDDIIDTYFYIDAKGSFKEIKKYSKKKKFKQFQRVPIILDCTFGNA